jgi:polar amino acid transport system substrate-binding protein
MALTKQSRYTFAVGGIAVLALAAGFLGGSMGGGGSAKGDTSSLNIQTATWINKIKASGELTVGCASSPPTIVVSSSGTCSGPDLLPLQDLATGLGVKLVGVATSWNNIVAGLQAGRYDVAADLDQTVARGLSIQFSDPSWTYPGVFVVQRSTGLKTVAQVEGNAKPVATAQGTALDFALQEAKVNELRVDTYQDALAAVNADRASSVFADLPTAEGLVQSDRSLAIIVPSPAIFVHNVAYGLPSGVDPRSLQLVNIAVDTAVLSGEVERGFEGAGYRPAGALGGMVITG